MNQRVIFALFCPTEDLIAAMGFGRNFEPIAERVTTSAPGCDSEAFRTKATDKLKDTNETE
ncbi:hypothetical protein [Luteolibacter sp. Populi]|uniref:hypothetical protein n=1 Tax=Luteolibacter sp. Populi TaxID=3230487 RepID=UPI003465296C